MDPPAARDGSGAGASDPRGVGASGPPAEATGRRRGGDSPEGVGTTRPSFATSAASMGTSHVTVPIRRRLGSELVRACLPGPLLCECIRLESLKDWDFLVVTGNDPLHLLQSLVARKEYCNIISTSLHYSTYYATTKVSQYGYISPQLVFFYLTDSKFLMEVCKGIRCDS